MSDPTTFSRRSFLGAAAAGSAALALPGAVWAQEGIVHLSVGFPPGGSGDIFARILADGLREELNRPVVVENRPGAGGLTVAVNFLRAPKDGSHIMLATGSTAVAAPISRAKPPYNPMEDFQWIALLSNAPFVIAINPTLPVRNLKELVAYAKERPGKMSYGHAGMGTTVHLAAEMFKDAAGISVVDVPYAGSAPAITDTIANNVQFIVETSGTLLPHHKSGRLRIISLLADSREKINPDIPTAREEGYELIAGTYNLLAVPAGTPAAVVENLGKATTRVMDNPAILDKLVGLGITPVRNSNPAQARAFMQAEIARWQPLVKKLNIAL
ncbi:Bug family tripartite tricarboxylate transporter substrate binding protein [Piscinibacter sakaiensis]|uniref:Bug family tripartite tricarboxylate transporter substrate binding protein n=1 Tax=Piscinibacter sakaiensis TaxID=1547922 RepID=UPI003AAD992C